MQQPACCHSVARCTRTHIHMQPYLEARDSSLARKEGDRLAPGRGAARRCRTNVIHAQPLLLLLAAVVVLACEASDQLPLIQLHAHAGAGPLGRQAADGLLAAHIIQHNAAVLACVCAAWRETTH